VEDPFRFLAIQGTLDMIVAAPEKVLPVIPQLILPMKTALNTRTPDIICPVLKILQQMMLLNPTIGQALVPYYR
jgi:Parkin co-regulated protein